MSDITDTILAGMTPQQLAYFTVARLKGNPWADRWISGADRTFESAVRAGSKASSAVMFFATCAAAAAALAEPWGDEIVLDSAVNMAEMILGKRVKGEGEYDLAVAVLADYALEAKEAMP